MKSIATRGILFALLLLAAQAAIPERAGATGCG